MKKIYTALDLQESNLISEVLHQNNINHLIKNATLGPLIGEIPMSETFPTVWVDEVDIDSALELIRHLSDSRTSDADWVCSCGEVLEHQFTMCWNCGRARP